ncbi:MAG: S8 family serine peptidase [Anaerolineaceae bacterium]|nr:S8 family serine peptidase [Anaerolineaceae bacterium]
MKRITWAAVLRVMVVVMCLVGLSVPASRVEADESGEALFIYLQAGSFDPLTASPSILPELSYNAVEIEQTGTYLLQFTGPVLDEWKAAVEAAGGQIGPYIPDYAFLVYLDGAAKSAVSSLPFVRWVGPYQPAYKLAPWVDFSERSYRVILAPWANKQQARQGLSTLSSSLTEQADGYSAVLDEKGIRGAAMRPEVLWIEPIYLQELHNDIGGGTIMGGDTANTRGYDGAGIEIAVTDTGLDTGDASTIHLDFAGRIGNISSWPVQKTNWGCGLPSNAGADDGAADTISGHGTHVTGSVAGDGTRSSGLIKGIASEAVINFQAVEQFTDWPSGCYSDGHYLTGIPDDVRLLLNEVYGWGARVQNNSWGGGEYGEYDQQASYFDDFIHSHPDMTVVVSAGNDGVDVNDDGYVDLNSITSPATAKNVITIGASDNERASGGIATVTWQVYWDFDVPPTSNDLTSDSREELAAFSSRGPMNDGRIKPDLVAPGTNILSTKSSQSIASGWGAYNPYYLYMGGTSMASPLSAGAATAVRDFLMSNGIANPSAALIKATLINSAVDIAGYGNTSYEAGQPIPNMHEGWGRINVAEATKPLVRRFVNNTTGLSTTGTATYTYQVNAGAPFKVSLAWSDPDAAALAAKTLVNDLNLTVTAPGGAVVYKGNVFANGWSTTGGSADTVNNAENVYVQSPTAGTWTVTVTGANIPQGPQPFGLVVNANFGQIDFDYATYLPSIMRAAPETVVINGDFESGPEVGWTESSVQGQRVVRTAGWFAPAHGGSWLAWLGGDFNEAAVLSQTLTIQSGTSVLSYWYRITSTDSCGYDYFSVKIGSSTVYTHNLCSPNATDGWVNKKIDLSAYAGQTVSLGFEVTTNESLNSNLFLDDVTFVATLADVVTAPEALPVEFNAAAPDRR